MTTFTMLKIVNPILALSFAVQAVTGALFALDVNVPTAFYALHKYFGLLMVAMVICHIALNWGWIKANILNMR
jgi:hypothetical protein